MAECWEREIWIPWETISHSSRLLHYNPTYCLWGPFHLQVSSILLSTCYPPLNWSGSRLPCILSVTGLSNYNAALLPGMQRTRTALSRSPCRLKLGGLNNLKWSHQPGSGPPLCLLLCGKLSKFTGNRCHHPTATLPTRRLTRWPLLSSHHHLKMLPAQHLHIPPLMALWTQELGVRPVKFFFYFYRNSPHYVPDCTIQEKSSTITSQ